MAFRRFCFPLIAVFAVSCTAGADLPAKAVGSVFDGDPAEAAVLAEQVAAEWLAGAGAWAVADIDVLQTSRVDIDDLGMAHLRMNQFEGAVPVFGGQAILHVLPSGEVDSITDGLVRDVRATTTAVLTSDAGIDAALLNHAGVVDAVEADLQLLRVESADHLTWRVQIDSLDTDHPSMPVVFVDARTGEAVWRYDNLQTIRDRDTYDGRNRGRLPGRIARTEGQGPTGDGPIDDAHDHAGITWDFYSAQEGRDSYDGAGATMISTAHHQRDYDNAFWNGSQMVYGDGDVYFYPLSGALDVVGHELTHAVTEFSANLVYAGESGGLNEATSDILGVAIEAFAQGWVIDSDTWKVGEDIATPALGDALRYMDDPTLDGVSIDSYADYYDGLDVHHSSGIANRAFYLMATSSALDLESAAHLWYRALTLYMTPSTTFAQARTAVVDAATDLHGASSAQVAAVEAAWASVGVQPPLDYTVIDTQTGLSASSGDSVDFSYTTGTNSQGISFQMAGGSGDADLYVRFGAAPTTTTYDCRPYATGNTEGCTFEPSQSGTYFVLINAYQSFSGLTLTVSEAGGDPPPPAEICDDGVDNDLDGATDCDDADCALDLACAVPEVCDDGADNDLDGDTDCDDSDWDLDLACAEPEACDDGIDNDLDGATDCDDSDCDAAPECQSSCPGGEFTGTLSNANRNEYITDAAAASGLFEASLTGDAGTNFDLSLQWLSGNRWKTRQTSDNADSNEFVSYNESSTVLHRWRIRRRSGSGDYALCVQ